MSEIGTEDQKVVKIPTALMGVIFSLLIQTGAGIWWASATSTKLEALTQLLAELKSERVTVKDITSLVERSGDHENRLRELERKARGNDG